MAKNADDFSNGKKYSVATERKMDVGDAGGERGMWIKSKLGVRVLLVLLLIKVVLDQGSSVTER